MPHTHDDHLYALAALKVREIAHHGVFIAIRQNLDDGMGLTVGNLIPATDQADFVDARPCGGIKVDRLQQFHNVIFDNQPNGAFDHPDVGGNAGKGRLDGLLPDPRFVINQSVLPVPVPPAPEISIRYQRVFPAKLALWQFIPPLRRLFVTRLMCSLRV